jgi:hypothetical protein
MQTYIVWILFFVIIILLTVGFVYRYISLGNAKPVKRVAFLASLKLDEDNADAQWRVYLQDSILVSCLTSELVSPNPKLNLFYSTVNTDNTSCNNSRKAVYSSFQHDLVSPFVAGSWVLNTDVLSSENQALVLGLSNKQQNGTYRSPFLKQLQSHGYSAWSFINDFNSCYILPGALKNSTCTTAWQWLPLLRNLDVYAIQLEPTSTAPWTVGIIDIGSWQSVFPGKLYTNDAFTLKTPSNLSINVHVESYATTHKTLQLKPEQCILGISALCVNKSCVFDFTQMRFALQF